MSFLRRLRSRVTPAVAAAALPAAVAAVVKPQARPPIEAARTRLIVCGVLFALAFVVISVRLVDLMALNGRDPRPSGPRAYASLAQGRAEILDRNGVLLATTLATASLYAEPKRIGNKVELAKKLHKVLPDVPEALIRARLEGDRSFVYIRRNLSPRQQYEVNRLGIPGLGFQQETKRIYPQGPIAAHVIGFADVDNKGLAGVERFFDERLRKDTDPLQLSIDIRVQHAIRQELTEAIAKFSALGGAGMVMDVATGEVLAMVSLPDFDPSDPGAAPDVNRFNRNTLGVYEMGSVFKIFNTVAGLDSGVATLANGYDATNPIQIGRFSIGDAHGKKRWLSVPEIFMYSSNIGSAKLAMDYGVANQRTYMGRLGLLQTPKIELSEVGHPQVPNPWRQINLMTISFGHGISVSPLQLVQATSTVVNGGRMIPATLLRRDGPPADAPQVIKEKTSHQMRKLMRLVVEHGTGRQSGIGTAQGYLVGGKTGSAEKAGRGGYREKALISSFIAAFPMQDPRYVVLGMLDEPKGTRETGGYATGGAVAAPLVGRMIGRIGPLLGVMPVEEAGPEIRRQMAVDIGGRRAPR